MFLNQLTVGLGLHSAHVRSLKEDKITEFKMTASCLSKWEQTYEDLRIYLLWDQFNEGNASCALLT